MNPYPATASAGIWSEATSTPMAMARSSPVPVLRRPEGARLTVMLCVGQFSSVLSTAARTRSRDSRHAVSGMPTMW